MSKILLIEDEPLVRKYLVQVLTSASHTVTEASEGKAGLEAVLRDVPDLIVTDLFMPGMEGIEAITRLRRIVPEVPILAMSGGGAWGLLKHLNHACALGAAYSLPKPVRGDVLVQVINKLLNSTGVMKCAETPATSPEPIQTLVEV